MSKIALRALLDKAGNGSGSFETKAIKVSITSKPLIPGLIVEGASDLRGCQETALEEHHRGLQ